MLGRRVAPAFRFIVLFWFLLCTAAQAAVIVELELNGTAVNNSVQTAQFIPVGAFTLPVPPVTVFDPPGFPTATIIGRTGTTGPADPPLGDRDLFSFFANGGAMIADIDTLSGSPDIFLRLFTAAGIVLGESDDNGLDPGSPNTQDPFLGNFFFIPSPSQGVIVIPFVLPGPGFYVLEVGVELASINGPQPLNSSPYTLQLSVQNPVAEPATLVLIASGLACLYAVAWRRRSRGW